MQYLLLANKLIAKAKIMRMETIKFTLKALCKIYQTLATTLKIQYLRYQFVK